MSRVLFAAACVILVSAQFRPADVAKLMQERRFQESAAILSAHLRENPADVHAHILLGLCYQQMGELGRSEKSFVAAVRLRPGDHLAQYSLARVRFLLGRFDEALAGATEALRLGEPAARVYHLRGRIEEERGRYEEALAEYRRALEADRSLAEALAGEASALYKLARYPEARASAQAALRLDATHAEAKRILEQAARASVVMPSGGTAPVRFVRQDAIDFRLEHFPTPQKHLISTMAGGLAVFDFDQDGRPDIFFANGAEIPSLRKTGPAFWNRLYRNAGNWRFDDVTAAQGLQGEGFSIGAAVGDFDRDGRVDLFVPGVSRNLLYRNTPDGFVEVSRRAGVRDEVWSVAAAWVDYDRDGWLDLFVVNYLDWQPGRETYCGDQERGVRVYCHPREFKGLPNRLYHNRGDGTFEDVTSRAGIGSHVGKGMSVAVLDADGDGWPDLFVTNDTQANFLFRNGGDGTFEEAALRLGVAYTEQGTAVSSMGVDARDYDNDGLPDLIVTALAGENFPLFRNFGKQGFRDVTFPSRLGVATGRRSGWGAVLADLNNDGWKDLITANSHVTDNVEQIRSERYREPNTIFVNRHGAFPSVQELGPPAAHRGLAVADFDGDGRLDAVVTVLGDKAEVWRNETAGGNWLRVRLMGESIGARIRADGQWQERSSASGYASSNLDDVHFGLGPQTEVRELEVLWPDGRKQLLRNVKAGQTVMVQQPARP